MVKASFGVNSGLKSRKLLSNQTSSTLQAKGFIAFRNFIDSFALTM